METGELSMTDVPGVRPGLLFEESFAAIVAVQENAQWQAAMRRRGIEDLDTVQIDPWPAGSFGVSHEEGRRICRCLFYVRHTPEDNGYAHPIEGVVAFVDMARGEVLEVADHGIVPIPPEKGSYLPEDNGPLRADIRPLTVTQSEGPSFTIEGNLINWQGWSMRASMDPTEGLLLHMISLTHHQKRRSICHRASVTEMVVPYGEPGPMHGWKNAFDAGEWGLGRMANSLVLGCDCVGEVHYLDAVCSTEKGRPYVLPNAICIHEEDYGILWKHADLLSGRTEVRRSRRLVVSSISTVGNYEYGFYWYFYLDGTMQFEVKLTGVLSTMAVDSGEGPLRHASMIAPQLAAPFHQHIFNVRLDVEIDGQRNTVEEVDVVASPPGPDNPMDNAFDAGEWGLGRMANSLTLGCDCLGLIHYFDAVCATEQGDPYTMANAICMHEEDYGILWKHNDMRSGRDEVRRSRRLVVSFIATVGNYEYGFYWYFYLDGSIQFEVKLTGILSTMAVQPGESPRFASMIAPQLAAPYHQHLFNVRLDMEVDGTNNTLYEMEARPIAGGADNPWGNAFESVATRLEDENQARRCVDPSRSRVWKVVNPHSVNRLGQERGYTLIPGASPTLLAGAESSVGKRATFATYNLWATRYAPDERRAAGDFPNQHAGGDGLPRFIAGNRSLVDEDIVLWHTFGVTHIPRPEQWPVMPVEYTGFTLVPVGFFDRNPALDVPATAAAHCHSE
jgi:Cu2+-containing amine oxidase